MCNLCNSGVYGYGCCSGGTGSTVNTTNTFDNGRFVCGYWNGGYQRMCRDACGNIITRNTGGCQRQTCCCPCYRPCGCGCGGNNGGTTGNNGGTSTGNNGNGVTGGNGIFRCITFCGYGNGGTQTTATNGTVGATCADAYYARQYGLTCDGNAECVYNF